MGTRRPSCFVHALSPGWVNFHEIQLTRVDLPEPGSPSSTSRRHFPTASSAGVVSGHSFIGRPGLI
jgi:hypothetical protein